MCLLEGLHYSGRHEPSFTPGEISLRGDFHHYQATEKSWAHNGPVLSVPYLINLFSENSVKDSVLEHCHALLYTVFFWIMASSFTMIYWLIYLFIIYFRILEKREQVSSCKFTAHKENRRELLFSDGPGWQESAFGKSSTSLPVEPVHKMITKGNQVEGSVYVCYEGSWEQSQFCHLWRENSTFFFKFYLFTPPVGANYPLFPHQDVVPLIGPSSRFVSPAACAEQQSSVGRAVKSLADHSNREPLQCPQHRWESPAWPQRPPGGNQPGQKGEVQGMTQR